MHLVGANGVGKTSLLRTLCGLAPVEAGDILWQSQSIVQHREVFLRDLCYLGHLNALQDAMTVYDNLMFVAALMGQSPERGHLAELLARFGVKGTGRQVVKHLSQGQKKRVALVRLALSPARLWVLDEPFVGMDDAGIHMLTHLIATHLTHDGLAILTSHQRVDVGGIPPQVLELRA